MSKKGPNRIIKCNIRHLWKYHLMISPSVSQFKIVPDLYKVLKTLVFQNDNHPAFHQVTQKILIDFFP